jgi:hypothetical protein
VLFQKSEAANRELIPATALSRKYLMQDTGLSFRTAQCTAAVSSV